MKNIFILTWCIAFLCACESGPCPDCGCENVDDCLSKYKFEEARKYASSIITFDDMNNYGNGRESKGAFYVIIVNEAEYWINQGELEKAKNIARELITNHGEEGEKKYIELLLILIKKHCEKEQFGIAKELSFEVPERSVQSEREIDITGRGGKNPEKYCKEKYDEIKANLNLNEEIESFSGCRFNYKVTTYEDPRKEVLSLIDEFKALLK
jgi:hypothetical protein